MYPDSFLDEVNIYLCDSCEQIMDYPLKQDSNGEYICDMCLRSYSKWLDKED